MGVNTGETLNERAKGKDVRTSNIVAAKAIADAIRTSLGPRGMDKMIEMAGGQQQGGNSGVLISNDGATILSQMKVLHPAAKMLVDMSQSQDIEAGDGTTTVVVLAGALLEACATLLQKGIHPTIICSSFLKACHEVCTNILPAISQPIDLTDRDALLHAVHTCLSSKVVAQNSDILAPIAVDSVLGILQHDDQQQAIQDPMKPIHVDLTNNVRIVQQMGGTVDDTELIDGLVLLKGSSAKATGGPTSMKQAKIGLIQFCLSAPKTDMDNNVIIQDYTAMDRLLREERKYILNQCKAIKKAGINVLLIQKSILRDAYNELSLHFLSKMNILVVTDIERSDIDFICKTLHCIPIAHIDQLEKKDTVKDKLGYADFVTDVFLEGASSKVVKFTGIQQPSTTTTTNSCNHNDHHEKTMTILLRGSNQLVLAEANRSLHDAQCVVRSIIKQRYLIAGGGAAEMEASIGLMNYATTMGGCSSSSENQDPNSQQEKDDDDDNNNNNDDLQHQQQSKRGMESYCIQAFADALEVIPYTLAENAGMKPIEIVTELRKQHASATDITNGKGTGINVAASSISKKNKNSAAVTDMYKLNIVQPLLVSTSALQLATETVCMIMKIDDLIVVA